MKHYFSYTRVSTVRQGQTGTSLIEQREAIGRYAARFGLTVVREYEEQETASKHGRPVFTEMMRELKRGRASGVIIHKIDRSARNLRDWVELGELMDAGFEVHFANEQIDLDSRGGRLSADIQAVVAADYSRNLREEVKKGIYGRIKQGFYPMPAPTGYVDRGKAMPKIPDPVQAPLVRQAFEMYATTKWSLAALAGRMGELGLRTKRGRKLSLNGLAKMLHNPFYTGLIHIKVKGEMYSGRHEPIVPPDIYNRVQAVFAGKLIERRHRHEMLFRRHLRCAGCSVTLIGEVQKHHVYYRCQNKTCPQKTVREELVEAAFTRELRRLRFEEAEYEEIRRAAAKRYESIGEMRESSLKATRLQLDQIRRRLSALLDAHIDGIVEKDAYTAKKNSLLVEEKAVLQKLEQIEHGEDRVVQRVEGFLEQVNNAYLSYERGIFTERRELVKTVTSNFVVEGKAVIVKLNLPFSLVAERGKFIDGGAQRSAGRTISLLLSQLCEHFK